MEIVETFHGFDLLQHVWVMCYVKTYNSLDFLSVYTALFLSVESKQICDTDHFNSFVQKLTFP